MIILKIYLLIGICFWALSVYLTKEVREYGFIKGLLFFFFTICFWGVAIVQTRFKRK